jgi:hypothetical protein
MIAHIRGIISKVVEQIQPKILLPSIQPVESQRVGPGGGGAVGKEMVGDGDGQPGATPALRIPVRPHVSLAFQRSGGIQSVSGWFWRPLANREQGIQAPPFATPYCHKSARGGIDGKSLGTPEVRSRRTPVR